jgi:tRNA (cytidine/uridine-2'-O-)-methyltransferase
MKHRREGLDGLPFPWPVAPVQVALVEPEIPPNTGNIARLCAATGSPLHLIGTLGFRLDDRSLKRAGLDYWDAVTLHRHAGWKAFLETAKPTRLHFFSARGKRLYTDVRYAPGDVLVFGSESRGLPEEILTGHRDELLAIPVRSEGVRSLNLATAVGIALYEALRQCAAPSGFSQKM